MSKYIIAFLITICSFLSLPSSLNAEGFEDSPYTYFNNVDNPSTVEDIKAELTVFDHEDGDLTDNIYVVLDNYTGNEAVLGDHLIVFGVEDSGGIETTVAITIRNVDINAPEFVIEAESTLNIPQFSRLSSNLPRIKAIDSFEGDLSHEVSITGLELIDTNIIGSYTLIYSVSDSSGNQTIETFIVQVVDSTNPEIVGVSEIIKRADTILDGSFYLDYFSATDDQDGIITNKIQIVSNEYIGNANNTGTYKVVLKVSDDQGNYADHILTIKVVKDMIPQLIIDKYYWVVENDYKIENNDFIDTLKFVGDLPNYTYVFNTTYDNYSNAYTQLDNYQKDFSLQSSTGEEFEREIVLEVVPSDSNIVESSPSFIESNSRYLLGGGLFVVVGVLFIIGLKKS